MSATLIANLANLALTLSLIVAVVFGMAQVKTAKRDRRERLTMETLRVFQSREFAEMILFITTTPFPKTYQEWERWPNGDRAIFIQLSQQMESVGMLMADGWIDIDLVDKTLGSFVTSCWEKFKTLIFELRQTNDDPFLSEYFQWMAEQVDKRMKERPRKPFYEIAK
jgi:hypothetical protein